MSPSCSLRAAGVLGISTVLAVVGCEKPAPKVWPAGTVFALDDRPILAGEIDAGADIIAQLEPDSVPTQARRIALTNIVLQRTAGLMAAGPEREKALEKALELKVALVDGATLDGPLAHGMMQSREGVAPEIGLEAWSYASTAPIGTWSEPLETVGAFEIVRCDERSNANSPRQVRYKVRVCVVPYLDENSMRTTIEERLDRATLVIVDPSWADIVPENWKHRLHVGAP